MEAIRTFIAVDLPVPSEALSWLSGFLTALEGRYRQARWVRPGDLHLTIRFLGNVLPARLDEIGAACAAAAGRAGPLRLEFGPPGRFGPPRAPHTLWIGFRPGPGLESLRRVQVDLETRLKELGFPPEERGWTPHITLGRNPRHLIMEDWESLLPRWPGEGQPSARVEALRLYSSVLTPDGPIHKVLREEPLALSGAPSGEEVQR
jgi:2'-5' RNA ligase